MEGVPKSESVGRSFETGEFQESINRAQELQAELQGYDGVEVVGGVAIRAVEDLAQRLHEELRQIPAALRLQHGLPWHPHEMLTAANDESYNLAA